MLKVLGRFTGGVALIALAIGAGAGLAGAPLAAGPAAAAGGTIAVNTTADSATVTPADCTPGAEVTGACNPRNALAEATALTGDVTITVPAGTYPVTAGSLTVDQGSGNTVTITGAAQATTIFQEQTPFGFSVFDVSTGTADISGVTIEDATTTTDGGGIINSDTLDLSDSTVEGNSAANGGGVAQETLHRDRDADR